MFEYLIAILLAILGLVTGLMAAIIAAAVGTDMAIASLTPQAKAGLLLAISGTLIAFQIYMLNIDTNDPDDYYFTSATRKSEPF